MNSYNASQAAGAGAIAGIIMSFFWLILLVALFLVVCHWIIYSKAGKPGWAAIIPIYNYIVLLEVVGKPLWWIILLLIPFVNIVAAIIVLNELSKCFGKGVGFTIGLIFLPIIFFPILAFGSAKYTPPASGTVAAA